jgi:hypothetical protein
VKILTKMEKKVQSHPKTTDKILFHQGLIKIMVMHALNELQVSWEQLLSSLGFKEQVVKTNKTMVSTSKGNTSKSTKIL